MLCTVFQVRRITVRSSHEQEMQKDLQIIIRHQDPPQYILQDRHLVFFDIWICLFQSRS